MGRRHGGHNGGGNEDSAMDMMSALIGCLIMILIGILVIVMVTQTMIIIVEPDESDLEAQIVSNRDSAIASSEAFPKGNTDYEPVYIDVERTHITFYPGLTNDLVGTKVSVSELDRPGNTLDQRLQVIKESFGGGLPEYVILLVRPNAAALARRLRKEINIKRGIPIGTELWESEREFIYVSATRVAYEEALLKKDAKTLEQLSAPLTLVPEEQTPRKSKNRVAMAGRRGTKKPDEFNPFIDILTCLAGVLILIIILVVIEAKDPKLLVPTPLAHDSEGKTPVYIEVNTKGEFFLVPVAEMNALAENKLKELTESAAGDSVKLLGMLGQAEARGEDYQVDLNYTLMGMLVLMPNPDAQGFTLPEQVVGSEENNWLTDIFDDLDVANEMVAFIVRANDNSYKAFKRARAIAWVHNLEVAYEVIDTREPIQFGLGGESLSPQ